MIFFILFLLFCSSQHNDNLALGFLRLKMGYHLSQRATNTLLMNLGNLTAYTHLTVSAIGLDKLLQRLH